MARTLRSLLLWTCGLLALFVGAAVVFLAVAGDEVFRRAARHLLESALERGVELNGTFSVTLGSEPSLVATDISVANAPWAEKPEMAHVGHVEVQVALAPLFSGVVLIPRLVIGGVTLDLQVGADGRGNWEPAEDDKDRRAADRADAFYPLIELLSVSDVTVTYGNGKDGTHVDVFVETLQNKVLTEASVLVVTGKGRVDDRPFEITGRFGSVEDALAATAPYPLQLSIELPELSAELVGTAANLPHAEGFDLRVSARTPSLGRFLETFGIQRWLDGRADVSAKLTGNLESLAAEDLSAEVVQLSGNRVRASGSVSDVWNGNGVDLQVKGRLGPEAAGLGLHLPDGFKDFEEIDISGRVKGDLDAPAFEDVDVEATYGSGARLSVTARAALARSVNRTVLSALAGSAVMYLPDPALLEQALGTKLPDLGAVHSTGAFSWSAGTLTIETWELHGDAPGYLRASAKGPLGKLSAAEFAFELEPTLQLSLSAGQSRPLVSLVDDSLAELGPVEASGTLVGDGEGLYRVDGLRVTLGSKSVLWLEAEGKLGPLRPGDDQPVGGFAAKVDFSAPSTRTAARKLGMEIPELGRVEGRFTAKGSPENLSIADARVVTKGPAGLDAAALGDVAGLSLLPRFAARGIVFDISAKSESTSGVSKLVGHQLPELGPVRATAALKGESHLLSLGGIDIAAGPTREPVLRIYGEIRDLLAVKGVNATGRFKTETARILGLETAAATAALGDIGGEFDLSDDDGSLGIESLKARSTGTELFSLSLDGKYDDVRRRSELAARATLNVPNLSALGRAMDVDAADLTSFSFTGDVGGGAEDVRAAGNARIGQTAFSADVSGSLAGARPSFRGTLHSPVFHLADFGLVPRASSGQAKKATNTPPFGDKPLPFDELKKLDLDLDVRLDKLKGIEINIEGADARVHLTDGLLQIDPLKFVFVGGDTVMRFTADARPAPPTVEMYLKVTNADLGHLFAQLEADVPLDGKLGAFIDVTAAGRTPNDLAAALNGRLHLAVEDGRIRSRLLDLAGRDLQSWLLSKAFRRGYADIDCFVGAFQAESGVAKLQTLVLDTPGVRVTGQGDIDFRNETVNIKFTPKSTDKRLINLTTPFTLRGPLTDPSVNVSTSGVAARTVGEVLMTPFNFLRSLFPVSSHHRMKIKHPCLDVLWPREG